MSGGFRNKQELGVELTPEELLWVQTGTAGVLLLEEQSSSPSATTGYGKLYVKTDKKLYYLNEDGTEVEVGAGSGITVETPSGSVNAVNATFTVSGVPKYIVSDGITYFEGAGYSRSTLTITMDVPPSQYIRAII